MPRWQIQLGTKYLILQPFHVHIKVRGFNTVVTNFTCVNSGCKTSKTIENLPPRQPHKFRLRAVLRASDVATLSSVTLKHYGDEDSAVANITLLQEGVQCANEDGEVYHNDK